MTYFPSPSEMAETGQVPSQAPQLMQASEMQYAMKTHLLMFYMGIVTFRLVKIKHYFR